MDLITSLIVAVLVVAAVVVLFLRGQPRHKAQFPYVRSPYLLSKAELSFYGVLRQAVGDAGVVFAKVRVADVVSPQKGLERGVWQRAFNSISAKHFDFLVCNQTNSTVLVAVELDDASHNSPRTKARDDLLEGVCEAAKLPLLRVTASNAYGVAELREKLSELGLVGAPMSPPSAVQTKQCENDSGSEATTSPKCPKCGADTVLRKARAGPHAGKQFWGCSTFPKCRGAVPHNA